jgi:hypothetical protein
VTTAGGKVPPESILGTFVQIASSPDDAAVAAAMTGDIDQLSAQIAITLQAAPPPAAR